MGYTPLFDAIVGSSVWEEALHVRVLWVSMLVTKNRHQVVPYRGVGILARMSNLTTEQVEDALKVLSGPDERRRGQEYDGRRIEETEDGWRVLNGEKYQKKMNQINAAAKMQRWRAKQSMWDAMTPEERAVFEARHAKEKVNRRKRGVRAAEDLGARAGAQEAIKEGLADI